MPSSRSRIKGILRASAAYRNKKASPRRLFHLFSGFRPAIISLLIHFDYLTGIQDDQNTHQKSRVAFLEGVWGNCSLATKNVPPTILSFTLHWHASRLEHTSKIQSGFLGRGLGKPFFGHKECSSHYPFLHPPLARKLIRAHIKNPEPLSWKGSGETVLWPQRMVSPENPRHFFLNRYSSTLVLISSLILRSMGKDAAFTTRLEKKSACCKVISRARSSI